MTVDEIQTFDQVSYTTEIRGLGDLIYQIMLARIIGMRRVFNSLDLTYEMDCVSISPDHNEAQKRRSFAEMCKWRQQIFALYPIGIDGFDLQKHH